MDLRRLKYFQSVAEELSFSKAAQKLRVAQPALSRAVQDLEAALGVELLSRTRRSVSLTPAGAVLLSESRLILQRVEEAVRRVQRTAAGEEGELRLGFIGPPTRIFLGRLVKEFRLRFPRVTVVLEERTPERVWEMVAQGRLTVGLTRPVLQHQGSGLKTILLRKERLYAVIPAAHPLARSETIRWSQLANEPLIILSRREGASLHDTVIAACREARFVPNLAHTPSMISTVLSYVEGEAGIGIVTDSISGLGTGLPLVFRPMSPVHTVNLVMVWSENNDTPTAASFRELLAEWKDSELLWKDQPV